MSYITCVGAGTIGHSWALLFAWRGFKVYLYDVDGVILRKAIDRIKSNLEVLAKHNVIKYDDINSILDRIEITTDLRLASMEATYIQESVPEDLQLKIKVFKDIEDHAPKEAIIASSTSSIPISNIQPYLKYPERTIVVHPINPPHLIPLVEVVPGIKTSTETIKRTVDMMKSLGRVPVVLKKEVRGFVTNRLSAALFHEMVWLVVNDIISAEDVDKIISEGLGIRWALMGQLEIWHIGGGDEGIRGFISKFSRMVDDVYADLDKSSPYIALPEVNEKLINAVEKAFPNIRDRVRWRDEMLIRLLKLKGYIP
jgi:3-hydroxyacyl-CoA dehydrogenase